MESRCIFPVFSIEQNVPINGIARATTRVVSLELIRETEAKLYREIVRGEKYMEKRRREKICATSFSVTMMTQLASMRMS